MIKDRVILRVVDVENKHGPIWLSVNQRQQPETLLHSLTVKEAILRRIKADK
jgi:hypothetical protein